MLSPRQAIRPLRSVVLVFVLYGLYWVSRFPETYDDDELPPGQRSNAPILEHNQLVVSVKTTTANAWTELPPQLVLTDVAYHDSLLLMGDLRLNLGPFTVEDVLDRYTESFVAENPELDRYRKTLDFAVRGVDLEQLREKDPAKEKEELAKLDKYKILRWVERTWLLRPERRWYIFTEPDVHLVRPNLLSWLARYDAEQHHFFVNPPTPDAGRSFILSQAVMKAIMVEHVDLIPYYDSQIQSHKDAFDVLTAVLSSTLNLDPTVTWPGISSYNPATIPYGPGLWCDQVLTLSKMTPDLRGEMWRFEEQRRNEELGDPLSFADLWNHFMEPENLESLRDDWDNLSSGPGNGQWNIIFENVASSPDQPQFEKSATKAKPGEESWEACRDSCAANEFCVQWSYSSIAVSNENRNGETKCHLSRSMRFGGHVEPRDVNLTGVVARLDWKSGWQKERFQGWARQQKCKN